MKQLLLLLVCLCSFACSSKSEKRWVVGTNAEYPPYTYVEKGAIVGFEIDLVNEVAHRLGKEVVFKDLPFDALIIELQRGGVDLVAAGISPTPERAKRVLFSNLTLSEDPLVFVSLKELPKKRVGVNEGYTADLHLTKAGGNFELVRLNNPADGFLALATGRIDHFATALTTVRQYQKSRPNAPELLIEPIAESTTDSVALALPLDHEEELKAINQALDGMKNDGTLDQLRAKWGL